MAEQGLRCCGHRASWGQPVGRGVVNLLWLEPPGPALSRWRSPGWMEAEQAETRRF